MDGNGVPRLERMLREAARAYEGGRLDDALPRLRSLASQAPAYPPARELYGLALYEAGRWDDALRELEAFAGMTGSTEQHPVMADCQRATAPLGRGRAGSGTSSAPPRPLRSS